MIVAKTNQPLIPLTADLNPRNKFEFIKTIICIVILQKYLHSCNVIKSNENIHGHKVEVNFQLGDSIMIISDLILERNVKQKLKKV